MPHDRHGNLVEVGDIVKGHGYNIKHEIIGEVVAVQATESCNLQVATARVTLAGYGNFGYSIKDKVVMPGIEYGATKDFEIVLKHNEKT